ncbi:MAG: hypothetical protein K6G69_05325 [Lachnospiraceae bacterium]|nr:hypothetical protein [Lachnospiraceae bacterium]
MAVNEKNDKAYIEELASKSELALANKVCVITLTVICSIMSAAYVLEVVKGARTVMYIIMTLIFAMGPVALCWFSFLKNNESAAILHIASIGYGILYAFLLFTAQNDLVFTYAIPMLIIISLYNDKKRTILVGASVCVLNVVDAVMVIMGAEDVEAVSATLEIQVLVMILIVAYLIAVSNGNVLFSEIRSARLQLQQDKTNELMQDILGISGHMTDLITNVGSEMERLQDSVDQTVSSMVEVAAGTNESAEAVQRQLVQTEDIQTYIGEVEDASKVINENISTTNEAVDIGKKNISRMIGYTEQVDKAGKDVAKALEIFKEATSKMNTITDLITDVASETSLLSLNASIEAARAGDAGRGFAVVASEISGLASQTTEATDNIVALIDNITSQVASMVETIQGLIVVGAEESKCAEETADSFNTIADNVAVIGEHSSQLFNVVKQLAAANKEIVDSIQTISSITEEVTAHATETHVISEQNQNIVRDINGMVESLNSDAAKLKTES